MWASGGAVVEKIDRITAWEIASEFELPRVDNMDDENTMETTIINQEHEEPVITELEIWLS